VRGVCMNGNLSYQAKLEAFSEVKKTLGKRQKAVLQAITDLGGMATSFEVADKLKLPINCVSGRFTELRKKGYITELAHTRTKPKRTIYTVV